MENRKGQGVFLGVVAVATLIVAIIGATFAYFSATINSDAGAVNVTAYEFSVGVTSVEKVAPDEETGIIPLATDLLDSGLVGYSGKGKCIDKNDHQVCQIYMVTLTNTGSNAITLSSVSIETATNGFTRSIGEEPTTEIITDLKAVYLGTSDDETAIPTTHGSNAIATLPVDNTAAAATLGGATVTVPASVDGSAGVAYLFFAVYLEEPSGDVDQSAYMSHDYSGKIILSSADGNHITGTFE